MNHLRSYIALFLLFLALIVVIWKVIEMNNYVSADLVKQDSQIVSLIQEVGELKQENLSLKRTVVLGRKDVDFLAASLDSSDDYFFKQSNTPTVSHNSILSYVDAAISSYDNEDSRLVVGTFDNQITSFLLLGMQKALSDTLIMLIIYPENHTITIISIPRDLFFNGRKINEYYSKFGIEELKKIIQSITGVQVDYHAAIDSVRFNNLIDSLGGIEVVVKKDLYDPSFPDEEGDRKQAFSIQAGAQTMDGDTVLKYVRSRKTTSDFDRNMRQQNVLLAIKDTIISLSSFKDATELMKLSASLFELLKTDFTFLKMITLFQETEDFSVKSGNILSTANFLYSTYNDKAQYILLPKSGDYLEIQKWVRHLINFIPSPA